MTLTKERAAKYIFHGLRGEPAEETPVTDLLNHAGHHLINMHDWQWTLRGQTRLDVRGKIAVTGLTYDDLGNAEGDFHLSKAAAFADYIFVEGDQFEVTGGTGAETKYFVVASRADDDAITLTKSISTPALTADGSTDIAGTLHLDRIALPSDFRKEAASEASNSLTNSLDWITPQKLLSLRTNQIQVTARNYFAAVFWPSGQPDGKPTPVAEIWPEPASDDDEAISMFYYAGWTELDDDQDEVMVPPWMEAPYLTLARAFAMGWENDDLDQRLAVAEMSPLIEQAKHRDGSAIGKYGLIEGGAVASYKSPHTTAILRSTIAGPT